MSPFHRRVPIMLKVCELLTTSHGTSYSSKQTKWPVQLWYQWWVKLTTNYSDGFKCINCLELLRTHQIENRSTHFFSGVSGSLEAGTTSGHLWWTETFEHHKHEMIWLWGTRQLTSKSINWDILHGNTWNSKGGALLSIHEEFFFIYFEG